MQDTRNNWTIPNGGSSVCSSFVLCGCVKIRCTLLSTCRFIHISKRVLQSPSVIPLTHMTIGKNLCFITVRLIGSSKRRAQSSSRTRPEHIPCPGCVRFERVHCILRISWIACSLIFRFNKPWLYIQIFFLYRTHHINTYLIFTFIVLLLSFRRISVFSPARVYGKIGTFLNTAIVSGRHILGERSTSIRNYGSFSNNIASY